MQRHELLTRLKALKLHGMASAFEELAAESMRRELPAEVWLTRMASGGKRRTAGALHPLPDGLGQIPAAARPRYLRAG